MDEKWRVMASHTHVSDATAISSSCSSHGAMILPDPGIWNGDDLLSLIHKASSIIPSGYADKKQSAEQGCSEPSTSIVRQACTVCVFNCRGGRCHTAIYRLDRGAKFCCRYIVNAFVLYVKHTA